MILVECKPDEALVLALGVPSGSVIHARGKSNVCRRLQKVRGAKGLVDEDPHSTWPPYMKRLKPVARKHDILVLLDQARNNLLIVLQPRLEEWIIKAANGLPDSGDELHKVVNLRVDKFTLLVSHLKSRCSMLKHLQKLLIDPPPPRRTV